MRRREGIEQDVQKANGLNEYFKILNRNKAEERNTVECLTLGKLQ